MTHLDPKPVYRNLDQLDDALNGQARRALQQELADFVSYFDSEGDTRAIGPETLTKTYAQLTGCTRSLQVAGTKQEDWKKLATAVNDTRQTMKRLQDMLDEVQSAQATKPHPFETERDAFLDDLRETERKHDQKIQRARDKLDEHYLKQMRESTFRNLVGTRQPI
ncbi:hypothetical protein BCR43DRAFT_481833 [Syncephalastrum racemosum]|uniref:Biogenesis of lysosome-related organelles complex 1 subunit 5 n=1 Tax=Syncephalastrum racemosum TaxID=13706 RepID=A0A1X2HST5_SYNRA|nr:hypothetical protein BCR43DRAFT_481833 [Syncephalastrum racemosum]